MENEELVKQFTDVTGVDSSRAKFYLQASNWELNTALSSFYEDGTSDNPIDLSPEPPVDQKQTTPTPKVETEKKPTARGSQSRFGTLGTLAASDSSSDEEQQAFYAGGSERSGQQVLGPSKGKKKDIVADMFKSAKEHGAEVVDPQKSGGTSRGTFSGAGYKLGASETEPTEVIGQATASRPRDTTPKEITLKLWKSGFSVNDEPVRDYQDPANKAFLDSVKEGVIPRELLDLAKGNEVQLNMEDHRHEDFVQTKKSVKAFSGQGHMLGGIVPTVIGSTGPQTESDRVANERKAQESVQLNESEPVTSIQIRLEDSTRLVGRFNHTHTIANVRTFIVTARPQYSLSTFALRTAFPPQELTNEDQTLKDANLLNAVVLQRST